MPEADFAFARKCSDISQSHYGAGGAPVRDPGSIGMNRGSTGMNWRSTGDERDFLIVEYLRDALGLTVKDRQRPARYREQRDGTGNNRDGISYGNAAVVAGGAQSESQHSYGK
ncbi:hypothetical protein DPMN_059837 [Dreissena polymorpha]|uniref:Uncharacterized protein n=1 Tax=Dreissena polymorpha TaxID=45954 RepID=A0A9D4C447_DREPO|nr:hypothetical protein DPMN_059837 [Dreissena polymorpha]